MKQLLLFCMIAAAYGSHAQTSKVEWLRRIGDSGTDACGAIATDSSGNVYVAGAFVGKLVFNTDTLTSPVNLEPAIFLAKYDPQGNALWGKTLPYTKYTPFPLAGAVINNIRVSQTGRIYTVGYLDYNGLTYGYISINRPDGSQVKQYSDMQSGNHIDIDIDSADNSYLAGHFASIGYSPYIIKLDSAGTVKWSYAHSGQDIRVSNVRYMNGALYVAGQFRYQYTLTDTVGSPAITLNAASGINDYDFYIAQYSKDGKLLAAHRDDGLVSGIAGPFECSSDFTKSGNWNVTWSTASGATFFKQYNTALGVLNNSTFPITTPCPFQPGAYTACNRFNEESVFSYSGLVCAPYKNYMLDGTGHIHDTITNPTTGTIMSYTPARKLAVGKSDNLFMLSEFTGTLGYSDSIGIQAQPSVAGSQDVFVAKFHMCPSYNPQITKNSNTLVCSLPNMQYQWYLDGNPIAGNTQTIVPATSGNYSVSVTDAWGCTAQATPVYAVSIGSIVGNTSICVFPNPVNSLLTIESIGINSQISLTDVIGQLLLSDMKSGRATIDLSPFAPGVYFLKIDGSVIRIVKN